MAGWMKQRSKDHWLLCVEKPRDGKRDRHYETFVGRKKAAEKKLAELVTTSNKGELVARNTITLGQHLTRWLIDKAKLKVSPRTFERYEQIVNVNIVPHLGLVSLQKLTADRIQAFYATLSETLKPRTVRQAHVLLHSPLEWAVDLGMIHRNPARKATPPRIEHEERSVPDADAIEKLIAGLHGTAFAVPAQVLAYGGLRRGELLGLRWDDLDVERRTLLVQRSLEETKKIGLRFKSPKTKRSRRTVTLPASVLFAIQGHRVEQSARLDTLRASTNLMFPAWDGQPWKPSAFSSRFKYAAVKLGYRGRVQDLRHAFATLHLRAGTPLKLVSEMLGHSSVSITGDIYSHVTPVMQDEAADRLEAQRSAAQEAMANDRATNGRQTALDGTATVVPIVRQRR